MLQRQITEFQIMHGIVILIQGVQKIIVLIMSQQGYRFKRFGGSDTFWLENMWGFMVQAAKNKVEDGKLKKIDNLTPD